MNMMAFEFDDHLVIVDCGVMFPDAQLLGVDIVIPDFSYVRENRDRVRAILLTHAHEDHIGGLPYLLEEVNVPVYGTPFTLALAQSKLAEHDLAEHVDLREMHPREPFDIGPFRVEFIHLTHSIIDSGALALTTPLGTVLHTGDFKFDPTPTDQHASDLHTLADYGRGGVLALFSDSTNIERPGLTPSERAVSQRLGQIMAEAKGRVLISCFATSLHRLQIVTDLAYEHGRKLCFVGRSMFRNSEIAMQMGRLKVPPGLLVPPQELRRLPAHQVAVVISGSQGEPMSAMARVAVASHRWVSVDPGDEVVLSARVIPGNEKAIFRMLDHLYRRGARVHYNDGSQPPVHVSGHGSAEELKLMLNLMRPKYFIPIHGEYRQLKLHYELAASMQGAVGQALMIESGEVLEFDELGARKLHRVPVGRVCIDSGSMGEVVEELIIKDRRHLSEDGIVLPIIAINKLTGRIEASPEIVMRGFAGAPADNGFVAEARETVTRTLEASSDEEKSDFGLIKEKIRQDLKRYIVKNTARRPLVMPVILEI